MYTDLNILIKYLDKNNNTLYAFDQELYKILKQINTIQFVINQMYIELSSFKNMVGTNMNNIEKYHHNCKVIEPIVQPKSFRFFDIAKLLECDDDDEEAKPVVESTPKRENMNVYRVWKE